MQLLQRNARSRHGHGGRADVYSETDGALRLVEAIARERPSLSAPSAGQASAPSSCSQTHSPGSLRKVVEKLWSLGTTDRFAHRCIVLERICLFNKSLVPVGPAAQKLAAAEARRLRVRHPNRAHDVQPLAEWWPSLVQSPSAPTAMEVNRTAARRGFSNCTPLVWLPSWPDNFAEGFINSFVPLQELLGIGVISRTTPLRPDIAGNPRFPISALLQRLSSKRLRTLHEAAPPCHGHSRTSCRAECYQKLLACRFRTAFEGAPDHATPWHMGQRLSALVPDHLSSPGADIRKDSLRAVRREKRSVGMHKPYAGETQRDSIETSETGRRRNGLWHVLFVNRSNSLYGGRRVVNLQELCVIRRML